MTPTQDYQIAECVREMLAGAPDAELIAKSYARACVNEARRRVGNIKSCATALDMGMGPQGMREVGYSQAEIDAAIDGAEKHNRQGQTK